MVIETLFLFILSSGFLQDWLIAALIAASLSFQKQITWQEPRKYEHPPAQVGAVSKIL